MKMIRFCIEIFYCQIGTSKVTNDKVIEKIYVLGDDSLQLDSRT